MGKIKTQRRVVLTGTPLQNNLIEYHCMIQFVKPLLLGTRKEFQNRFVHPISNGQCADSNQGDVKLMKKRVHILHKLLEGCVQRCDYNHVTKYLPPKFEFVISVRLSDAQIKMYRCYLDKFSGKKTNEENKVKLDVSSSLFKDHHNLRLIWTHPYLLRLQKQKADLKAMFDEDSMSSFINDGSSESEAKSTSSAKSNDLDNQKPSTSTKKKGDDSDVEEVVSNWKTRSRGRAGEQSDSDIEDIPKKEEWWNEFVPEEDIEKVELSGKILLLFEILKQCELVGDKVLLFTQSLLALDLLEDLLKKLHDEHKSRSKSEDTENVDTLDAIGTWENGIDYFRMDGSTGADLRKRYIEYFNNPLNDRARLFMISTRAGSLGTNLVGANRVVILDASWNPTHDVQAIFRVYRFGQKKPVYVYRLLAQGAMEETIYDRQVTKQSMAFRVVDEQQIERHFNAEDLDALYSFNPEIKSNRPTPMVPKDRLLAELLINEATKDWIVTYHEHDSLLENITAEELTEDERKVAWAEYEAEREGLLNQVQHGQMNFVQTYLLEILDKFPTDNLLELFGKIRQEKPTISQLEIDNMVLNLDRLCIAKCKELQIVSLSLQKNNEVLPDELKKKMERYVRLINEIKPLKEKQLQEQARLMNLRKQQEQLRYQQQLRQQQQQQAQFQQQQRAQFQQQQQQQQKFRPQAQVPGFTHNMFHQSHFQRVLLQQQQFQQRPAFANVNQANRNVNEPNHTDKQKTYARQNVIVTRGPIITEDDDDHSPTTSTSHSASTGPIITEID